MFLRGLRVHGGWHGDRFLGAADGRVFGRIEDRWAVVGEGDRRGFVGAAEFALGGGAAGAVVAVGVGSGDRGEFVAGQFGGLLVVGGGLFGGRGAWEWSELQEGGGGGGAVEPAVCADRAVVGAVRAAVVGVQVADQVDPELADRECPGLGDAVAVAGVDE